MILDVVSLKMYVPSPSPPPKAFTLSEKKICGTTAIADQS
jgi:hypothetical protein